MFFCLIFNFSLFFPKFSHLVYFILKSNNIKGHLYFIAANKIKINDFFLSVVDDINSVFGVVVVVNICRRFRINLR